MPNRPLLEIRNLKKDYPRPAGFHQGRHEALRVLQGGDLRIFPGETVGLCGASGSGKTTLAHCIFGLTSPTAGEIHFSGQPIRNFPRRILARHLVYIFQNADLALNPRHGIGDSIAEPLVVHKLLNRAAARARARELLTEVGLAAVPFDARPAEISAGERQRVQIARALALRPRLLVADEPFASLDAINKKQLLRLFAELKRKFHLTYLLITHDVPAISDDCDRVLILQDGKIVEARKFRSAVALSKSPFPGGGI